MDTQKCPNDEDNNNSFGFEAAEGSMDKGIGDGDNVNELKLKMAALESKNALLESRVQMLESKLENPQALNSKHYVPKEDFDQLNEKNETLAQKLRESEQTDEIAKNKLEEHIQTSRHKLEGLANKIAILKEQQKNKTICSDKMELSLISQRTKNSLCLRLLPLETWADIFGFLPRPLLAEIVPEIGDWHFAERAQYFLHECSKITLDSLEIRRSSSWINRKVPIVKLYGDDDDEEHKTGWEFPLADVPISKNIKNFKYIHISYYDKSVTGFLQKFHPNSLLTNINLSICTEIFDFIQEDLDSNALNQLVPFFTSVEQLNLLSIQFDLMARIQNEYFETIMASTRILIVFYKVDDDWFCKWLCTPREDGKSRVLVLHDYNDRSILTFIELIKKDFTDSNGAISFFIEFSGFRDAKNVHSLTLDNVKTNEKLVIKGAVQIQTYHAVTISRHPMQANEEWVEEMGKYSNYPEYRNIEIEV